MAQEVAQEEGEEGVCRCQEAPRIPHRRFFLVVSSLVRRPLKRCSASKFAVVVGVATEEAVAQEEEEHKSAILGIF